MGNLRYMEFEVDHLESDTQLDVTFTLHFMLAIATPANAIPLCVLA